MVRTVRDRRVIRSTFAPCCAPTPRNGQRARTKTRREHVGRLGCSLIRQKPRASRRGSLGGRTRERGLSAHSAGPCVIPRPMSIAGAGRRALAPPGVGCPVGLSGGSVEWVGRCAISLCSIGAGALSAALKVLRRVGARHPCRGAIGSSIPFTSTRRHHTPHGVEGIPSD